MPEYDQRAKEIAYYNATLMLFAVLKHPYSKKARRQAQEALDVVRIVDPNMFDGSIGRGAAMVVERGANRMRVVIRDSWN